jgi:GNAT superfamily N-acetyltransferase
MLVRRLTPAHAADYRALMLQAYADEPEAFTATVAEREAMPLDWWAARVADHPDPTELVFGAFEDARLVGVAGLRFEQRPRTWHKATLFGMVVQPPFRGRGLGRALVEAVIAYAEATPETQVLQLTVTESNAPARRLYEASGFVSFGTEPCAIRVGERLIAKVHMWRAVGPDSA